MGAPIVDFEEKRLEKLPPRELSRYLMSLPVKKRLDLILQRADAEEVVAALSDQDFFFSVKELGPDDSLPLLSLARVDQLNHLFDLEWWKKDQIAPASAVGWLEKLARASEEKFLAWIYEVDFDLLVSLFKKWIRLEVAPEDIDLAEAREQLPLNTLDDHYFWETRYPQYEDFLKGVLSLLFELSYGFYKELMNNIIYAVEVEVEEEAYRFHRGRLEDRAIPDYYDALEIYRAVRPNEVVESRKLLSGDGDEFAAPSFALALLPEKDLLTRALREVKDPLLLNTLQMELASLSNKVLIADRLSLDNPEVLRSSVDKAGAYVSLGLQVISAGRLENAVKLLEDMLLERLFRLAHTEVMGLRDRMRRELQLGWLSKWPVGLEILDQPWMEAAELLLERSPRILRVSAGSPKEDIFRSREDLIQGKHIIDVIASLEAVFEALRPEPEGLRSALWKDAQINTLEDVTLGSMLWTAAARFKIENAWRVEPLPVRLWPKLFPSLAPKEVEVAVRIDGAV